jgi:hypothetical protein
MTVRASALLADERAHARGRPRRLMPLPIDDMVREADATGRVLVVDETGTAVASARRSSRRSSRTASAAASSGWPAATATRHGWRREHRAARHG